MKSFLVNAFRIFKGKHPQHKGKLFLALIKLYFLQGMSRNSSPVFIKYGSKKINGDNYASLDYVFKEIFIGEEYRVELENERPVIFDCGANVGCATIYFKERYPTAQIYCFEPQPKAYGLLQKNIQENKLDTKSYNMALSNRPGTLEFFIPIEGVGFSASINSKRESGQTITVDTTLLSAYTKQHAVIDLVKIDVEGAEFQLMEDLVQSGELSSGKILNFVIEYHHRIGNEPSRLAEFLHIFENAGYDYHIKSFLDPFHVHQDILLYIKRRP
jgi:FkbM family methyltransferase